MTHVQVKPPALPRLLSLRCAQGENPDVQNIKYLRLTLDFDAHVTAENMVSLWPEVVRSIQDFTQIELPQRPTFSSFKNHEGGASDHERKCVELVFDENAVGAGIRRAILENLGEGKDRYADMIVSSINNNLGSPRAK